MPTPQIVDLLEAIGPDGTDVQTVSGFVHLLATDTHSTQSVRGFSASPLTGTGTVYSCERWLRIRFSSEFETVGAFRVWAPNLTALPIGWVVNFGMTDTFTSPSLSASSVAVSAVPTTDPGQAHPNCGGDTPLVGPGEQYTNWIVLQASVDLAVALPGPVPGFSPEGSVVPMDFRFNWTET